MEFIKDLEDGIYGPSFLQDNPPRNFPEDSLPYNLIPIDEDDLADEGMKGCAPETPSTATTSSSAPQPGNVLCKWGDCRAEMGAHTELWKDHVHTFHTKPRGRNSTDRIECQWDECSRKIMVRSIGVHIAGHFRREYEEYNR